MKPKPTLQELISSEKSVLTPADVSGVLGSDPQTIRLQARLRPDLLGFPVVCVGNRVKIPRLAFLQYIGAI